MDSPPIPPPVGPPKEVVILCWLHGFKGGKDTFAQFPERVVHLLSSTDPETQFVSVVYPPYDTRGELIDAVVNHATWLEKLVLDTEKEFDAKGGQGLVRVVLLGHSMGGLVIADAALSMLNSVPPIMNILGLIAYDTPYYGLNPSVFKNTAEKFLSYAQQGQAALTAAGLGFGMFKTFTGSGSTTPTTTEDPPPTSSSTKRKPSSSTTVVPPAPTTSTTSASKSWLPSLPVLGAAAALAAGASAAYWQKDTLTSHWTWATSHLSFVGELWKTESQEGRMVKLERVGQEKGVGFHWSDGMYELGTKTCTLIREWLVNARSGKGALGLGMGGGAGKKKQGKGSGERLV